MEPTDVLPAPPSGCEWIVEARGCDARALADPAVLRRLVSRMVDELGLHPVGSPVWHRFPDPGGTAPGGVTGLCLLAESHLAVHTFPEHRSLCLNLFCCRPRPEWDFAGGLADAVGAEEVEVRRLVRSFAPSPAVP